MATELRQYRIRRVFLAILIFSFFTGASQGRPQPPEGKTDQQGSAAVTLEDLIRAAADHNPDIQASKMAAHAARLEVLPAGTLPDPMITFQNMGDPDLELMPGDPSSARVYGLEQEFPFPGKLALKEKIASSAADVEEQRHALTRLRVLSEIKENYYDLFFVQKSEEIIQRTKRLLQDFVQIAQTRYQVGIGIQQDVVKAHVELSKLIDRLLVIDKTLRVTESRINGLLYRPVETPIGKVAPYRKSELANDLKSLIALAEKNSPSLLSQEREVERLQVSQSLAGKGYYPDFSLGFNYYERRDNPEMYGLMVKATVPLYFWRKQTPQLEAARASLRGAQRMREQTISSINAQIRELFETAAISDQQARLYDSTIVPQARLSLESAVAGYQTGKVDFLTLLDNLITLLDYELKYNEMVSDFQKALARMEPLVGKEMTQ